jgi:hypothetical protein
VWPVRPGGRPIYIRCAGINRRVFGESKRQDGYVAELVTIATGSRPPGITTVEFTAQQLSSFPGESMTSYEVTPWLDGVAALARRVSSVKTFAGSCIWGD